MKPASTRAGLSWSTPYFAPSTIVIGAVVVAVSILAGRFTGAFVMQREAARYGPPPVAGAAGQMHAVAARGAVRRQAAHPAPR